MSLSKFITHRLRLDWSEMDLFGHINNVSYSKYIQSARVNYWEVCGITLLHESENIGPMLAATSIQFKKALHYPGEVIIETELEFIKTSSFGFHHLLKNQAGELVAEAHDVMVMYDFNKNEKKEVPGEIKKKMEL